MFVEVRISRGMIWVGMRRGKMILPACALSDRRLCTKTEAPAICHHGRVNTRFIDGTRCHTIKYGKSDKKS